jgi:phosphoglucosamine mutase
VTRLFGTDGIRGVANADLTPELAFAVGRAGAAVLAHAAAPGKPIVIGRDTRLSGTMLEAAMIAGITSTGRNVVGLGVVPTPCVAAVTVDIGAAAGVMISASHNPIEDNGIKFFGSDGFKLSDAVEDEIGERLHDPALPRPTHTGVGIATLEPELADAYVAKLVAAGADLSGWTIVVDAANGAAYLLGPLVFARLGAHVIAINAQNDGANINVRCGATNLDMLQAAVRTEIARGNERVVGVAFDGDADRAKFIDETGAVLDGDHVLLILGRDRLERGDLPGSTVVSTVMSNIGLQRAFDRAHITMLRAAVGDRYVLEEMRAGGYRLGGEQSGHVIDLDRNTTGDGAMTAVLVFSVAARKNVRLHELASELIVFPQILINVRVADRRVADDPSVTAAVFAAERQLGAAGRILVRPSGTESLVRVMVEASTLELTESVAKSVADVVQMASENDRTSTR